MQSSVLLLPRPGAEHRELRLSSCHMKICSETKMRISDWLHLFIRRDLLGLLGLGEDTAVLAVNSAREEPETMPRGGNTTYLLKMNHSQADDKVMKGPSAQREQTRDKVPKIEQQFCG